MKLVKKNEFIIIFITVIVVVMATPLILKAVEKNKGGYKYSIEILVPDQIIKVEATNPNPTHWPTSLCIGIQEAIVSYKVEISSSTAINTGNGYTKIILLHIKPK